MRGERASLPLALRAGALLWLAIWIPAYAIHWGWHNFFAFCDMAVILGCLGLATQNSLLVSSQALPTVTVGFLWLADVLTTTFLGKHVFGGTEYMFDSRVPLWVRLLSVFHLWLPAVFVLALRRLRFHARALPLQVALTLVLVAAGRFIEGPGKNLNYAYRDPIFHRQLGPVPLHVVALTAGVTVLIYLPSYLALRPLRRTVV
jgi:hypothetical protein